MAKIVMLGAGLGGMAAAYEIREMLGSEHDLTVVVKRPLERRGIHFIALPQIPPRNVTKSMTGKWVHLAKVACEKYVMQAFGIDRLKPDVDSDA